MWGSSTSRKKLSARRWGFSDFSTSALGPGTPAKRSVSKNDGQRYQGNVLNRIQSRDFEVFVFYRGERLFGMRLGRFITLYRSMHALRFTSMDARFSFRSALARFALYLYQMLPYKYARPGGVRGREPPAKSTHTQMSVSPLGTPLSTRQMINGHSWFPSTGKIR